MKHKLSILFLYFVDGQVIGSLKFKLLSGNHEHFGQTDRQTDGRENSISPNTVCGDKFTGEAS